AALRHDRATGIDAIHVVCRDGDNRLAGVEGNLREADSALRKADRAPALRKDEQVEPGFESANVQLDEAVHHLVDERAHCKGIALGARVERATEDDSLFA